MRRSAAATVTASSGPIHITLELLDARITLPNPLLRFRVTLKNIGTKPINIRDKIFESPEWMSADAGIFLEILDGAGRPLPRTPVLPEHDSESPYETGLTPKQLHDLAARARAVSRGDVSKNTPPDFERPAPHRLMPGDSVRTPSPSIAPFIISRAGRYKVRLVYDRTPGQELRAIYSELGMLPSQQNIRVETGFLEFEVGAR